jgi:hypothetical protein
MALRCWYCRDLCAKQSVANRMLAFAYKPSDGRVPECGAVDAEDRSRLEKVEAGFGLGRA